MSNPNKRKGSQWERDASAAYEAHGLTVYRPHQYGWEDQGDRHCPPFLLQMKNYGNLATGLRLGVEGAVKQAAAANLTYPVALVKRRNKHAREGYAVMRIESMIRAVLRIMCPRVFCRHKNGAHPGP